ncbi:MAG: DUF131 domain-containing protein [Nitrososphaerota archaeon]|nr:DUF131 domain-containing protein [Nitrososphaerota archaeon]
MKSAEGGIEVQRVSLPVSIRALMIGFALIFAGTIILMLSSFIQGFTGSAGLVVFIGPIPIIFGVGEAVLPILILALLLTAIGIAFYLILRR